MLEGLDEALVGMSAGESTTFASELAGGDAAGEQADVTVTVQSVKVKELPELDDDFAQLASEFDTLGELRADTRRQLERVKKLRRASQAQDRAVDALLESVEIPLPEKFVEHEMEHARESVDNQLAQLQMPLEDYLSSREQTEEEFEAELLDQSQRAVKRGFILDEVARAQDIQVNQTELSYFVADQAQRMGIGPEYLARQLSESGQIGAAVTEVLRGKAATYVAEQVKVTDEDGNAVDVKAEIEALNSDADAMLAAQAAAEGTADGDAGDDAQSAAEGDTEAAAEAEEDSGDSGADEG
jgi:trigger factor